MLDACRSPTDAPRDAAPVADAVQAMHGLVERLQGELRFEKTRNEALDFEIARLKRWRFGTSSESLDSTTQGLLFDAIVVEAALEDRAAQDVVKPPRAAPCAKGQAARQALPASLPRIDRHQEIDATHCECGAALERIGQEIGQEVSEQLDCVPAQFFVLATSVAGTAARAARPCRLRPCPRRSSTRALRRRACWRRWWWPSTTITCRCIARARSTRARQGQDPQGVCVGVPHDELRRPARGLLRREIAGHAVALIARLYEVEREARELEPEARWRLRQRHAKPVAEALHAWHSEQHPKLAKADLTAKAIDHSLGDWRGPTHCLDDGHVPIDNNGSENAVRPLALGRKNGVFVGSQQAGERAAVVLGLIESAKLNGHDPWAHLKDVFERLPTLKQRDPAQLLPHNWQPPGQANAVGSAPVASAA